MALILRNGGSQSPDRWLKEPRNNQTGFGIFGLNLLVGTICTRQLKLQEHVGQAHILCFVTLLASFHAEGAGHVGLAAPRGTGDEQIAMLCDVFTGCKALNQTAIELPAGSVIDICDVSLRLVKSSIPDKTLQAVALSVVVFDIDQEAEAILKRRLPSFWDHPFV